MKNEPHKDLDYVTRIVAIALYARACAALPESHKEVIQNMYHLNDADLDFVLDRLKTVRIELRN